MAGAYESLGMGLHGVSECRCADHAADATEPFKLPRRSGGNAYNRLARGHPCRPVHRHGGFTGLWTAILAKQMRPDLDRTQLESRLAFQPFGGHDSALIGRLFLGDSKRNTRVSSFLALHSSSCRFISGTSTS